MLFLCASAVLSTCTKAQFEKVNLSDGGARDVASPTSDTRDAPALAGTCQPGTANRSKGKAQACGCNDECQSGFCTDGVCCTSACDQSCKSCNLRSSLGDCAFVPAGGKPGDPLDCVAGTPATCGQDGTCDGRGGCRRYVQGTECKPGRCDGDRVTDILTCDGEGRCSQAVSRPCPPYACDPTTNRCATTCTNDSLCSDRQECVANRCGQSANGADCQSDGECSSGFCVDEVCCNIACSGPCVACDQTGSMGRCTFLAAGMADSACLAEDPTTCGHTGLCDGSGSCTLYPESSICGPSTCSGLRQNTPRTCDGQGTCRDPHLVDCAPFLCSNGACQTSCVPGQSDTCEPGHACVAQTKNGVTTGICGQRKNGQVCANASDCESGACVDGVCCESDCAGACRSCNLPDSPGRCLEVAAGAPDPRNTCRDLGASSCSTDGLCDGRGACQTYATGTLCGKQTCVAGAYNPPPTCNAIGQCVASRSRTCSPFTCNGDTCYTACGTNAECAVGEFCIAGSCGLKPRGAECTATKDCASGFCAQGVCCDSACTGACQACNLTASAGTCMAVPDNAPDPQGKCLLTDPALCGTTGTCLKGACAFFQQGLNCAPAVCATSSSVTPAATCDGKGACRTPVVQNCGVFACVAGACKSSCTKATEAQDCVPPNTCDNNSCGLKQLGAACTNGGQCASGFCTEGVCCNSMCADAVIGSLCKTCKGTQSVAPGTCANVDSGGADPKSRCSQSNASAGDCSRDGTCNGAGACRPWASSTGCRQESCTGSTHTLPAACDGAGNCPAAVVSSCGSYVCSSASPTCLNTCSSNADCTNGLTCLTTTNRCGDKVGPGGDCGADSDCTTGHVCSAEGVCCDRACAGGCQSCRLPSQAGVCSNIPAGTPVRPINPPMCVAAPAGACGASGNCNGSGTCEQRTTCAPSTAVCPSDLHRQYTGAGLCSASGACEPQTSACGLGYLCFTGGTCATTCTSADASTHCDIAGGYDCIGGVCSKKGPGVTCSTSLECASGNCVDGRCCSAASCPDCTSCNVTGHEGACYAVPAGTADGACVARCPPGGNQSSGLCDGSGICRLASPCPGGALCGANNQCASDCTSVGCAAGFYCSGTTCAPLKADGAGCAASGECANGHCISNGSSSICCSTACTDVPCGSRPLCNVGGNGCQMYAEGSACAAGSAACSTDQRSSIAAAGTCASGACQATVTPCLTGYLCVDVACVGPGGCTPANGCDRPNMYHCNTDNGNCELQQTGPMDAGP